MSSRDVRIVCPRPKNCICGDVGYERQGYLSTPTAPNLTLHSYCPRLVTYVEYVTDWPLYPCILYSQ